MTAPVIVSAQEWEAARQRLLVKEKELTCARDALAAQRRRMPWLAVDKQYAFDGPAGPVSLLDLFAGRRQVIVYREVGVTSSLAWLPLLAVDAGNSLPSWLPPRLLWTTRQ